MISAFTVPIGDMVLEPQIADGCLRSIGGVRMGGVELRNPTNRFLPWFDTYDGHVFRSFALSSSVISPGTAIPRPSSPEREPIRM